MTTDASPARRRGRARLPDTPVLDRRAILSAALRLVDEEGLEALSMRRLGARLGVEAMTLYYYIPGKAALLQGLAEVVLDELELPTGPAHEWPTIVREVARSFRRLGLRHPNVFPLLSTVGLDNAASHRPTEAVLHALRSAGFEPHLAFTAFFTIKSYVVGHVLWILGDRVVGRGVYVPPAGVVPAEDFPILASYLPYLAARDVESQFEFCLDVIIAGLEALLAQPSDH